MKNIFSGLLGQVVFFSHPSIFITEKHKVERTNLKDAKVYKTTQKTSFEKNKNSQWISPDTTINHSKLINAK